MLDLGHKYEIFERNLELTSQFRVMIENVQFVIINITISKNRTYHGTYDIFLIAINNTHSALI